MALCIVVEVSTGGPGSAASATGKTLLPWVVGDASFSGGSFSCPVGSHVLLTGAEASQQVSSPLLNLTAAEGAEISSAILLVWAVGWAFRALIQAIRSDGNSTQESE